MEKNATKLSQEDFSNSEEKVLYMNKMLKKILDEAKTYDISQCPLDFQEAWNDYLQKQNAFLQKQEEDCKFITKFNEKPPANQKELEQLKKIRDDDFEQTKNLGEKATKALAKVHEVSRKYLPNLQNKE
jgi:hypothetical protein